jgi:hypothetical protein
MKKVLAIFLAFIIGLSMSAQIQNKLLGFTLGTSTKYEIRNKYKNERSFSEEDSFIMVRDIRFASQHWDYVAFYFFENKLMYVSFSNIDPYTPMRLMESTWDNLKERLWDKYSDYYVKTTPEMIQYSDGVTNLALSLSDATGSMILMLLYSDVALKNQELQAGDDEL